MESRDRVGSGTCEFSPPVYCPPQVLRLGTLVQSTAGGGGGQDDDPGGFSMGG